jgi:hypothetical protein
MIASDVINSSLRGTLDDTGAAKWTDAELWAFLADGVRYIQTKHPRARLDDLGSLRAVLEGAYTAGTDTVDLDPIYQEPLREYVLWRAFGADKGDAADARRAQEHEASLKAWFTGPEG